MHLLYLTLLFPSSSSSSSSFTKLCSMLSMYQIACGFWTALVWEQCITPSLSSSSSVFYFYIPMALIIMTSLSLRFLPTSSNIFGVDTTAKSSLPYSASTRPTNNSSSSGSSSYSATSVLPTTPWYHWTAEQVQEWVQTVFSADDNDVIVSTFRQHENVGMDLLQLCVSDYHQAMGLRLGVACRLQRAVETLQRNDAFVSKTTTCQSMGWLEQLDQQEQYTNHNDTSFVARQPPLYKEYAMPSDEVHGISTEAMDAMFQERFGRSLELPQLASISDHRNNINNAARSLLQRKRVHDRGGVDEENVSRPKMNVLRTDIPLVQNGVPRVPSTVAADEVPEMPFLPPHIHSIYQRKPHMVNQMILARQQEKTHDSDEKRALLSEIDQDDKVDDLENGYRSID